MKRLKNAESKNEKQSVAIKDQGERRLEAIKDQRERQFEAISIYDATNKSPKIKFDNEKNQEAKEIVDEVNKISRENKYKKFVYFHSNGTPYNFSKFRDIKQLGNDIFNGHISIKQAKDEQDEMKNEIKKMKNYNPTNEQKIKSKEEVFNKAKQLFEITTKIIKAFKDGIFPLSKEHLHKEQAKEVKQEEEKRRNNS